MCQSALPSRFLSLPTHVSISTVCSGVRTMNVWIRDARSPVASSKKCGRSHPWCAAMASGVESGSMEVVGNEERPTSTTGTMVTSPGWIAGAVVVMCETLHHSSSRHDRVVEVERRSNGLHGFHSDPARDGTTARQGFSDHRRARFEMTAALTDRREQLLDHGDE